MPPLLPALLALILILKTIPISVTYHFTRQCNKNLATSRRSPPSAQQALFLLHAAGMKKINFAGGEPFLPPRFLSNLLTYCKQPLHLESVSIVTNGSLVTESFLAKHGHNIDILAVVSCDSFDPATTNARIGRGFENQIPKLYEIRDLCRKYGIKFKVNTVVCRFNVNDDMNRVISELDPFRWKCFQVLVVGGGENDSSETKKDARGLVVTDEEFDRFCGVHCAQRALSYLILDEYLRFLDRDGRQPSPGVLEVGVERALECVFWDQGGWFVERGGVYDWFREGGL
ncbi:radical SAM enzyme [Aspergillus ellipticus CBS 707.79]|uniref:Radical SAM enzyme n=1 Tax=Aspergillus ellipticus CBS 707.79 TaxID=1448320 RepID=A0A319CSF3_9EURO|nr:radical SAM enzyme [Aspergillus ellipticus CBS 707.79]